MYNNMRITGLASGIDTEEMIRSLMAVERVKVNRVEQDRQILLWRQEMYNNLNKDFANFILNTRKMFGLTSVNRDGSFRPNHYYDLTWIKKAVSSNESIATVSATADVLDGTYKVEVKQLAEGVNVVSGKDIRKEVEELEWQAGEVSKIYINKENKVMKINAGDGVGTELKELTFYIHDGKEKFIVDVKNENGITMRDVANAINNAKPVKEESKATVGIRASYDTEHGRFFLQTKDTGEKAIIQITAADDVEGGTDETTLKNFINALSLTDGEKNIDSEEVLNGLLTGKDAIINFNGAQGISSSTNWITVNGITMNLVQEGSFTITIGTDVDAIYEKVEEFINQYNELVEKTNKLLGEKRYRDYPPLTAEQKKEMDKSDIELWEEKAKSGLLRNDSIIQSTMLSVRQSLYELSAGIEGSFKLITDIGISTEKYSRGSAGGKLVIDEQKLRQAIADDPEGVMELLFKESNPEVVETLEDGKEIKQIGGLVTRIYDNLIVGMEEIIKKSGTGGENDLLRGVKGNILMDFITEYGSISMLDKDILQYSRRIDDLNDMLFRKENHYYIKFTAMERAISRMNQQSLWLMQQFSSY